MIVVIEVLAPLFCVALLGYGVYWIGEPTKRRRLPEPNYLHIWLLEEELGIAHAFPKPEPGVGELGLELALPKVRSAAKRLNSTPSSSAPSGDRLVAHPSWPFPYPERWVLTEDGPYPKGMRDGAFPSRRQDGRISSGSSSTVLAAPGARMEHVTRDLVATYGLTFEEAATALQTVLANVSPRRYDYVREAYQRGWITLDEARIAAGLKSPAVETDTRTLGNPYPTDPGFRSTITK